MKTKNIKKERRLKVRYRIRKKISGTAECPRLAVYKSNRDFYAQIINDEAGKTLLAIDTRKMTGAKHEQCVKAGEELAGSAALKNIKKVVFDRSGYIFASNIRAFSDAARQNGLNH
ncbi:MAG: 50S ribosomal protein L18 [Bacteroidota bacterium]